MAQKYDDNDPENTGLFAAMFYGRPKTKNILHGQILLAARYWGCKASYEFNSDDYYTFFTEKGSKNYLMKTPVSTIDPGKRARKERVYGVYANDPFSLTKQLDTMIAYIEYHCHKIYFIELLENLLIFDPENRTKFDLVVAAMLSLVSGLRASTNRALDDQSASPFIRRASGGSSNAKTGEIELAPWI